MICQRLHILENESVLLVEEGWSEAVPDRCSG